MQLIVACCLLGVAAAAPSMISYGSTVPQAALSYLSAVPPQPRFQQHPQLNYYPGAPQPSSFYQPQQASYAPALRRNTGYGDPLKTTEYRHDSSGSTQQSDSEQYYSQEFPQEYPSVYRQY